MRFPVALLRRVGHALAALLLVTLSFQAPPALASGETVWQDCGDDGQVNQTHSQSDYTDALKNPPADGAEYSPCLDLIRQAQIRASTKSGGGGSAGGGGAGGGSSAPAVAPEELSSALRESGVDPAAPQDAAPEAPAPVTVDGERIDLSSSRVPSIASALSLPLPLAASAIVVLLSAGLPLVRYVVARFGGPPTGTGATP
jgi:hypothetical protein